MNPVETKATVFTVVMTLLLFVFLYVLGTMVETKPAGAATTDEVTTERITSRWSNPSVYRVRDGGVTCYFAHNHSYSSVALSCLKD